MNGLAAAGLVAPQYYPLSCPCGGCGVWKWGWLVVVGGSLARCWVLKDQAAPVCVGVGWWLRFLPLSARSPGWWWVGVGGVVV